MKCNFGWWSRLGRSNSRHARRLANRLPAIGFLTSAGFGWFLVVFVSAQLALHSASLEEFLESPQSCSDVLFVVNPHPQPHSLSSTYGRSGSARPPCVKLRRTHMLVAARMPGYILLSESQRLVPKSDCSFSESVRVQCSREGKCAPQTPNAIAAPTDLSWCRRPARSPTLPKDRSTGVAIRRRSSGPARSHVTPSTGLERGNRSFSAAGTGPRG